MFFKLFLLRRVIGFFAAAGMAGGGIALTTDALQPAPSVSAASRPEAAAGSPPSSLRNGTPNSSGSRTAPAPSSAPAQPTLVPPPAPAAAPTPSAAPTPTTATPPPAAASASSSASARAPQTQPAPPPAPGAGSGVGVPTGDLPGWNLVLSEDFTRSAPLGSFAATYPGWSGYDGGRDTSRVGSYNSNTVVSVQNGVLDKFLHPAGSGAHVAALTPPIKNQLHGRYAVRFRADAVPGYKIAWLLWPGSGNWTQGELDFPEADLDRTIAGFAHDTIGNPSSNAWAIDTGAALTEWHTAVLEWSPGRLTYTLDGRAFTTTDPRAIPSDPMRWVLQSETSLDGRVPTGSAHISIDWVAAWAPA